MGTPVIARHPQSFLIQSSLQARATHICNVQKRLGRSIAGPHDEGEEFHFSMELCHVDLAANFWSKVHGLPELAG